MKTVLLIGGGGTLGTYTAQELLSLGHRVDILCPEEKHSDHERLTFYQGYGTKEFLEQHFATRHYDGIVNFIHYPNIEDYPPIHRLLMAHTDHLIVLSSYRVYADEQHPITETAPMLLDVSTDQKFIETEKYAISKAKLEKYLRAECAGEPWTIVRPVISFSWRRFDLVTYYQNLLGLIDEQQIIPLPTAAKDLGAGIDWAGNSGKLIAHLLFKKDAIGEAFTVSSAQNLTWGAMAELYTALLGAKFRWVSTEEYLKATDNYNYYALLYDRLFDRTIDNRKILQVTGLTPADFTPIKEGLQIELKLLKENQK